MSLPYFPMYPTDFEADTSHLTLAEDGAYNRLLRLCWMTPGCSLPDDEAWIMRRMRARTDEEIEAVRTVLAEFFKRDGGRLFSPRLRKEAMLSEQAHARRVAAGRKGGRPAKALENNNAGQSNDKPMPKQPEPEPDIEANASINPPTPRKLGDTDPQGFPEFWAAYPRKVAKGAARKAWLKATRTADPPAIIEAASRVEDRGQYTPHPATWLNAERWNDEPEANHGQRGQARTGSPIFDAAMRFAERERASRSTGDGFSEDDTSEPRMDCGPGFGAVVPLLAAGGRGAGYG